MIEIADRHLPHLPPAAARLGAVFGKPKTIAMLCVLTLAGLGWIYLGLLAGMTAERGFDVSLFLASLCQPSQAASGSIGIATDLGLIFLMWSAMALAMMLPTAAPMILTYAEIADTAAQKGVHAVSPFVLAAGYAAIWLGFAALAAPVQIALNQVHILTAGIAGVNGMIAGALFIGAGAYQFSSLKQSCLAVCQRPFPFFFANWRTTARGVFGLGLRQGLHCLGCCWAMMMLMFAVGAMNIVWMAALGLIMTIEKVLTTPRFSHAIGIAFIAAGVVFMIGALVA